MLTPAGRDSAGPQVPPWVLPPWVRVGVSDVVSPLSENYCSHSRALLLTSFAS
jgi:hypothetical protein